MFKANQPQGLALAIEGFKSQKGEVIKKTKNVKCWQSFWEHSNSYVENYYMILKRQWVSCILTIEIHCLPTFPVSLEFNLP